MIVFPVGWCLLPYMVRMVGRWEALSVQAAADSSVTSNVNTAAANNSSSNPKKQHIKVSIVQDLSGPRALGPLTPMGKVLQSLWRSRKLGTAVWWHSWEDSNNPLPTPNREEMTAQSEITTKIPFGEPISFVELLTGNGYIRYYPMLSWNTMSKATWIRKCLFGLTVQRGLLGGEAWQQAVDVEAGTVECSPLVTYFSQQGHISWNLAKQHTQIMSKYSNTWA